MVLKIRFNWFLLIGSQWLHRRQRIGRLPAWVRVQRERHRLRTRGTTYQSIQTDSQTDPPSRPQPNHNRPKPTCKPVLAKRQTDRRHKPTRANRPMRNRFQIPDLQTGPSQTANRSQTKTDSSEASNDQPVPESRLKPVAEHRAEGVA